MSSPTSIWSDGNPPRLLASRDETSGALRFPAFNPQSPLAARCHVEPLASEGRVYSFTVIHSNPKLGLPPFALGYVDVDGQARILGRIRGEGLKIGARCVAVPDPEFGYAFDLIKEQ